MEITVLYFSLFRDLTGQESQRYDSGERELTVAELLSILFEKHPGLREWDDKMLVAVNCEYANRETPIRGGDEVALMPPVQGG